MVGIPPEQLLARIFEAAIEAAQPHHCIPRYMPDMPKGRLIVIGAGKASAAMAAAFESVCAKIDAGLVVTRYGYGVPCKHIDIVEAAHPVPDNAGLAASKRIFELVSNLREDDTVVCLISGGGSALLPLPFVGLTLDDKQEINRALLKSGATISEMNCVRRHLSAIKGGRLAAACYPARVVTLAISDVPGDNPMDIASGPTVADTTSCADALDILARYKIDVPAIVTDILESGRGESIKPSDIRLARSEFHLVATPRMALEAAASVATDAGYTAFILGDSIEGEARDVGLVMSGIARSVAEHGTPVTAPCILLSGGETTVTVSGSGRGGRNVEFLLSLAVGLNGSPGIYAIAGDTDGVDGAEEVAGAILTPDTLARAWEKGLNPRKELDNNNGHGFFETIGDQVITGPTLTNVNDFRAVLINTNPGYR